ncbi:TPA: hypothetical protein ACGF2G_002824 [Vibrio cholerae]|uniref:hypothetical protein n=1 Tax=Vibrio cholerae TaxID=666 RepID=UPI00301A6010|nr:hypothetical protein [Vibrio cholerae]
MNIKDYITILSVFAVIIGWFINGHLNRKNEVFKKRFDYLMDMYESYVIVAKQLEVLLQKINPEKEEVDKFIKSLEESQVKFLMLGSESEIEDINKIVELAKENKHKEMKLESAKFIKSIRIKMRKIVGVDKI